MNSIRKSLNVVSSLRHLRNTRALVHTSGSLRSSQYYEINDNVFGLNEDQKQLRQTVFNFAQKELAPRAQEIDQQNGFTDLRVTIKKKKMKNI